MFAGFSHWLRTDAEPLPGYRLRDRRGTGGFGEVWEAVNPQGQPIALKFMALEQQGKSRGTAKEIRAIQNIQKLYHPNITYIHAVWSIHDAIVIAMDLADRSLQDLLLDYKAQGQEGLPLDELLGYMAQAAEVLDFLNHRQHPIDGRLVSVQHCDVKPSNFLLFGSTLRIADFGLSKVLTTPRREIHPSGTICYSPPEVYKHTLTERSDQYALAVTYCVLRTGQAPFTYLPPSFSEAVMLPQVDLRLLTDDEQRVIERSMALAPGDRWPNCVTLVQELAASLGRPRFNPTPRKNSGRLGNGSIHGSMNGFMPTTGSLHGQNR